jgi:glycogen debranching enzyme
MRVTPTADGRLIISDPAPNVRYDMGNKRLFAKLNGAGDITLFRLPEGIGILAKWQVAARLDGVPVQWNEAEAIGRSWTLQGCALDADLTLATVCDAQNPALAQVWTVTNPGPAAHVFTLQLDVEFDLSLPAVRVGPSSASTRMYEFVRDHPLAKRALGARRWSVLNPIGEAQKRLTSASGRRRVTVEPLRDGFRARGDITATLRAGEAPLEWQAQPNGALIQFRVVIEPGATYTLPVVIAAGETVELEDAQAALAEADEYAAWLTTAFEHDDSLLRSMAAASLNVALAMYKELPSGFAGLWAGPGYAFPPRIYFRDGYWTALSVLPYRPEWVRNHLLTLATGIHPDGECPSGVIDLSILPFEDQEVPGAADWLSNHHDSPAFYVLLLHEYVAWTGDTAILRERVPDGRTLWECAQGCLNRLIASPAKERAPNDWTDNVLRSEWVTYDLALLYGALNAAAEIAREIGESDTAAAYAQDAHQIGELIQIHGWDEAKGYYVDYRRTGDAGGQPFVEDHLALDTLLVLRFGAAPQERADRVIVAACNVLQTRRNLFQPYEDWGVMCCWPTYRLRADLFGKSAQPYNYHNGAEWPYLSAMYAQILMERGDPDWYYVLTRWWQVHLKRGWLTPVEYYSPVHPVGAFLQGWSGMALSAMLVGGLRLRPALDGTLTLSVPPWGASVFRHVMVRGEERTIQVRDDSVIVD